MCTWPRITAQYSGRYCCEYDKESVELSVVKKYRLVLFKPYLFLYIYIFALQQMLLSGFLFSAAS